MSHRSYDSVKPGASKLLSKKWDDAAYDKHRKTVKSVKSTIDTRPPKTHMHVQLKLKKLQLEEERLSKIEKDNRILLERMSRTMRTKGGVDNANAYQHKSLNRGKRQAELKRITKENQAILKRIQAQKPSYDRSKWDAEAEESVQRKKAIARFPDGHRAGAGGRGTCGGKTGGRSPAKASGGRSPGKASGGRSPAKRSTGAAAAAPASKLDADTKQRLLAAVDRGEAADEALEITQDKARMKDLWGRLDYNGNGKVSLAEIDKMCVERNWDISKPAMMRAYKQTTLKDGDGDAWVEKKEFPALIQNLYLCERLWDLFDDLDTGDDRRIDVGEFEQGMAKLGCKLTPDQAEVEFAAIDKNGGGQVLFDEFCAYVAGIVMPGYKPSPPKAKAKAATSKQRSSGSSSKKASAKSRDAVAEKQAEFKELEEEIKDIVTSGKIKELWTQVDFNGNGLVSLAEIDKFVVERYPLLNHKPALMRAYKHTTLKDGDGDAWVEKKEFKALLRNLFYFNQAFVVFEEVDTGDDRRIDASEFKANVDALGLGLSASDAQAEFEKIDKNGGGQVLFDEFCLWLSEQSCPF